MTKLEQDKLKDILKNIHIEQINLNIKLEIFNGDI